jgi:hypothetical protein
MAFAEPGRGHIGGIFMDEKSKYIRTPEYVT